MRYLSLFLCLIYGVVLSSLAYAQTGLGEEVFIEESAGIETPSQGALEANEEEVAPKRKMIKDMSASELAVNITSTIDSHPKVLNFLPYLKRQTDATGQSFYIYKGKRLDDLDRDELMSVLRRMRSELTRMNVDRINKQIATAMQAGQTTATADNPADIATGAPSVPQIPQAPSLRTNLPQDVRLPKVPPVPPRQVEVPKVPRVPAPPTKR